MAEQVAVTAERHKHEASIEEEGEEEEEEERRRWWWWWRRRNTEKQKKKLELPSRGCTMAQPSRALDHYFTTLKDGSRTWNEETLITGIKHTHACLVQRWTRTSAGYAPPASQSPAGFLPPAIISIRPARSRKDKHPERTPSPPRTSNTKHSACYDRCHKNTADSRRPRPPSPPNTREEGAGPPRHATKA